MADRSKIEWTQATWNPVTGCTKVSPGCDHCYAETFAERWRGTEGHHFENGFDVQLRPERLDQPLKWKKPRRIFVNSMSDLFHESVPDKFIGQVFETMGAAKQHTFQLLTKRHGRMRSLLRRWSMHAEKRGCRCPAGQDGCSAPVDVLHGTWPLPNVWLGVSAEDQWWADVRIPALLQTPAAIRWVSVEPLINPLGLYPGRWIPPTGGGPRVNLERPYEDPGPALDWIVVGGESGPGARRVSPGWIRHIVEECQGSGVPVFVKQMGSVWATNTSVDGKSVRAHGDSKGGDWEYWPEDLRIREFPIKTLEVATHG